MYSVNEQTTMTVTLDFSDENGDAVTPNEAQYRLDDIASDEEIIGWTVFEPLTSSHDVVISYTENAIINAALEYEKKRLTVSFTYGLDNKKATAEYIYAVKNMALIP
jgi:hypothetical protein